MNIVAHANNPELSAQMKPTSGGGGLTAQGFYIIDADGTFYGWDNTHYLPNVIRFLDAGLAEFRKHPPSHIEIPNSQLTERFSHTPDATTSVVRVFTRIRPIPEGCNDLNKSIGRDHLWIYSDEAQEMLDASKSSKGPFPLSRSLVGRLVRWYLTDNVRGEPDEWQKEDIKDATFTANLVGQNSKEKQFHFTGKYAQETANQKRGQQGTLEGRFDILIGSDKVVNFRAYGKALAWGRSTWTPGEPKGKFGLVTAMVSADDPTSQTVAPHFYWGNGGDYRDSDYLHL